MSTKVEHNTNRTSVKLAVLLTAGLIGGVIIPSVAWAQGVPTKLTPAKCTAIQNQDVMVFVVGQNPPYVTYYGESNPAGHPGNPQNWAAGTAKDLHVKDSVAIGVTVGNPTYCYTLGGSRFCVTY